MTFSRWEFADVADMDMCKHLNELTLPCIFWFLFLLSVMDCIFYV